MLCYNGRDTGCDIPGSVRRLTFSRSFIVRKMKESDLSDKSDESRESNGRLRVVRSAYAVSFPTVIE